MNARIEAALAMRKIERALMRLELTFAECVGLVTFDAEEATASWRFDQKTGEESIHIGPTVANLDVPAIEMVLRHEILHRSMYHGFGEMHAHKDLANLTLDVCINRLLYEAYPDEMRRTASLIYPAESKTSPIALADASADPTKLPNELSELWQSIWIKGSQNQFNTLNPASLYFRLLRLLEVGLIKEVPLFCKFTEGSPKRPGARTEKLAKAVAGQTNRRLPRGSDLGQALGDYSVIPVSIGSTDVEAFLEKMRFRKIVDETAKKVLAPLAREVRKQPYPTFLTRLGLVYEMCGISESIGMYINRDVASIGARMAIGIYMDVSGSMLAHFPVVAGFVDALKEAPLVVRVFDTAVRTVDVDALAKGNIQGGGGTDFDAPLRDLLDDRNIEAGVLFTDGEADVSREVMRAFRASRKRLFVVYLLDERRPTPPPGALHRLAKDTIVVPLSMR